MTDKLTDYIKLAESATDGPWESFYEGSGDFALYQISNGKQDVARIWANQDEEIVNVSGPDSCMFGGQQSDRNAEFIAASRNLGPAMAKALIEAEKHLDVVHDLPGELNLGNYTDDDVRHLNDAYIQAHIAMEQALATIENLRKGE